VKIGDPRSLLPYASLAVSNSVVVGEVQRSLAAATMGGRIAMPYYFVQTLLDDSVDDPLPVLSYLLAAHAASSCQYKFQIGEVIERISRDAYLISDELWALRPCPLDRPSDAQIAELQQQIAIARTNAAMPKPYW
jgi:hypothetical protein